MTTKETLDYILVEQEAWRHANKGKDSLIDHAIRVCQAQIAHQAGYTTRTQWVEMVKQRWLPLKEVI